MTDLNIDKFINDGVSKGYIVSKGINNFTIQDLESLAEKAKLNNLVVTIKSETSNIYQGVLVSVVSKNCIDKISEFL